MIVVLMFAIPFGLAFLSVARFYPQQPPDDHPMVRYLDPLLGDTPKYVPPQETAEKYYSQVTQLNELLSSVLSS